MFSVWGSLQIISLIFNQIDWLTRLTIDVKKERVRNAMRDSLFKF